MLPACRLSLSLLTYFITYPCGTLNVPRGGRQKNKQTNCVGGEGERISGIRLTKLKNEMLQQKKRKNERMKERKAASNVIRQRAAENPNDEWQPKCWRLKSFLTVSTPPPPSTAYSLLPQPVATSGRCQRKWKLCQMRHARQREREREN